MKTTDIITLLMFFGIPIMIFLYFSYLNKKKGNINIVLDKNNILNNEKIKGFFNTNIKKEINCDKIICSLVGQSGNNPGVSPIYKSEIELENSKFLEKDTSKNYNIEFNFPIIKRNQVDYNGDNDLLKAVGSLNKHIPILAKISWVIFVEIIVNNKSYLSKYEIINFVDEKGKEIKFNFSD